MQTKKKNHRKNLGSTFENNIKDWENLGSWKVILGKTYTGRIVDKHILEENILEPDGYPFYSKPLIYHVFPENFFWEYDPPYWKLYCHNEDVLLEHAKRCEILLIGNTFTDTSMTIKAKNLKAYFDPGSIFAVGFLKYGTHQPWDLLSYTFLEV